MNETVWVIKEKVDIVGNSNRGKELVFRRENCVPNLTKTKKKTATRQQKCLLRNGVAQL